MALVIASTMAIGVCLPPASLSHPKIAEADVLIAPSNFSPASSNTPVVRNGRPDTQIAALVKLMNERSLQPEVSNLQSVEIHYNQAGQPVALAIKTKNSTARCRHLEDRLRKTIPGNDTNSRVANGLNRHIQVRLLEPDLKEQKSGFLRLAQQ